MWLLKFVFGKVHFECFFLNIAQDASDYVDIVGKENFGYLYDTFHANIEEKDPVGVIGKTVKNINHIHISENDRGTPGKGNVRWKDTFQAIRNKSVSQIYYDLSLIIV